MGTDALLTCQKESILMVKRNAIFVFPRIFKYMPVKQNIHIAT